VLSIQSVYRPEKSFILQSKREFTPFVAAGLLSTWKVFSWTPDALKTKFGHCKIASYIPGTIGDFVTAMMSRDPARTADEPRNSNWNAYGSSAGSYTSGAGLPGSLWKEFPVPPVLKEVNASGFPQLWMGWCNSPQRPVTPMHCDTSHGFLCQVFGKKRLLLYSPDQDELLYADRAYNYARPCRVANPLEPDCETYPLFKHAQSIEVVVNPGEVFFIPAGWFHCAFAPDPVMSISITCAD